MEVKWDNLIVTVLLLVAYASASDNNCMVPVTDPGAIFGTDDSTTPILQSMRVDDFQHCNDECCKSEPCNVALYTNNASESVANCALYACHPTTTCNIKATDGVLIFIDKTSLAETHATSAPTTTPPHITDTEKPDDKVNKNTTTTSGTTGLNENTNNTSTTNADGKTIQGSEQKQDITTTPAAVTSTTSTAQKQTPSNNNNETIPVITDSKEQKDTTTPPAAILTTTSTALPTTVPVPKPTTQPPLKATPTIIDHNVDNTFSTTEQPPQQLEGNLTTTTPVPLPNVLATPMLLDSTTPRPVQGENNSTLAAPVTVTDKPAVNTNTSSVGLGISSTPVVIAPANSTTPTDTPNTVLYSSTNTIPMVTFTPQGTAGLQTSSSSVVMATSSSSSSIVTQTSSDKTMTSASSLTPKSNPGVAQASSPLPIATANLLPSVSSEKATGLTSSTTNAVIQSSRTEKPAAASISVTSSLEDISTVSSVNATDIQNFTMYQSNGVTLGTSEAMTAILICALAFGCVFLLSVIGVLGKRIYDGYKKRHYSRLDYLINGMYN